MKNFKFKMKGLIREAGIFNKEDLKISVEVEGNYPSDQVPISVLQETTLLETEEKGCSVPFGIDASISVVDSVDKIKIKFIAGRIEISIGELTTTTVNTTTVKLESNGFVKVVKFVIE